MAEAVALANIDWASRKVRIEPQWIDRCRAAAPLPEISAICGPLLTVRGLNNEYGTRAQV